MWAMKARDQFHKEQQRPCRNVTIDEQMTASVEGQQNSSTSLRPRTALRRGANVLPMQDGGVRLALLGRPQRVIMGTVSCSNNTPKKCQKKKKKIHRSLNGFNPASNGRASIFHLHQPLRRWKRIRVEVRRPGAAPRSGASRAFGGVLRAFGHVR